jgi:hypothetical protein
MEVGEARKTLLQQIEATKILSQGKGRGSRNIFKRNSEQQVKFDE